MKVNVRVKISKQNVLNKVLANLTRVDEYLAFGCEEVLKPAILKALDDGTDVHGQKVVPLRPATIAAKELLKLKGHKIPYPALPRYRYGDLYNSIETAQVSSKKFVVHSELPYAAAQQFGFKIGEKFEVPPRRFFGIRDDSRRKIVRNALYFLKKGVIRL